MFNSNKIQDFTNPVLKAVFEIYYEIYNCSYYTLCFQLTRDENKL